MQLAGRIGFLLLLVIVGRGTVDDEEGEQMAGSHGL